MTTKMTSKPEVGQAPEEQSEGSTALPSVIEGEIVPAKTTALTEFWRNTKAFMIAKNADEAKYRLRIEEQLVRQVRPAVIFGGAVIAIGLGFFVVWGGFAPLDSAVIGQGSIVLSGSHKAIQHLEGGIIEEIFVKEGQTVVEGESLIKLNDTQAKANVHVYLSHLRFAKALEKRLVAEEQDLETVDFTDPVLDMSDNEVQVLVRNQQALFDLNSKALKIQIEVYEQRVLQKNEELNAQFAREQALKARLATTKEQLSISQGLYDKGLEAKTRLLQYQEQYESINGELHMSHAMAAKIKEELSESELHKIHALNDFKQKVAEKYKETRSQVLELEQKLQASRDVLERTIIKAPDAGIITGLKYHTVGGVIPHGDKLMDIVPQNDLLIVEAFVSPQFIESMRVGLAAKVQLDAYKSRLVPRIDGEIIYVSADRFTNDRGESYYTVKIKLSEESIQSINMDIKLYPGMPVSAFIVRGTRTFLQFIIAPIIDSFHRSFKEA